MRAKGRIDEFKKDIIKAVSAYTNQVLLDWFDDRLNTQFDTNEAMRRIDVSLLQYLK
jgi:hypothetical protein